MRRFVVLIALFLVAALPSLARAQAAFVRGKVVDSTGAPIARATVSVEGRLLRTLTNDTGGYEIRGVPPGAWTLRARAMGYTSTTVRLTVVAGQPMSAFFTL